MSSATSASARIGEDLPLGDKLYDRLRADFRADADHWAGWLKKARESYKFYANDQWSEDDVAKLRKRNRARLTINSIMAMIDAVSGYEVANRQETRYIPRQIGQSGVNELLTSAAAYMRDNTDADSQESSAFRDTCIAGVGCTETYVDFDENEDGDYRKRRVSPLHMVVDRHARAENFSDAKRVHRIHKMTIRQAMDMFPEVDRADIGANWADGEDATELRDVRPDAYARDDDDTLRDNDIITIVETQWWEFEHYVRFIDPGDMQEKRFSLDEFAVLVDRLKLLGLPPPEHVKQKRKVFKRAYLGRGLLADVQSTPVEKHFTYKFITGKRDEIEGHFFGLVEAMKDLQRFTNALISQITNIIARNAKGGLIAERGAFENPKKAAEDWAKDDSIVYTKDGAIRNGAIQPKPQTQINPALFQMLDYSSQMMPRVTGINLEFLGMREASQAGVLEYQRRQAGITILATLFDALRLYRIDEGRMTLGIIQKYLSDGRLVKIVGEEGAQYLPLNRGDTLGQYEVIVDDAPTSPNHKERTWAIAMQMLPLLQEALQGNPSLTAEFFKASPLPDGLTQKLVKAMTTPPPGAQEQQEAGKAAAFAKINRDDAAAAKDKATAIKTMSEIIAPPVIPPQVLDGPFPVGPEPPPGPPGPPPPMGGLPGLPPLGTVTPPPMPSMPNGVEPPPGLPPGI